ncbi:MAG TPA: serine hydrolase domain-containing protein [Chryseosolibacter sp.]
MRTKFIFVIAIAILTAGCQPNEPSGEQAISRHLDSLFQTVPDFSAVMLVADNGQLLYQTAVGYRNFHTKDPLAVSDIFELASVSKQFTAMIIMMLKEEGKLAYDDPIDKYVPGLPYPSITIRNLLNHTSGLPDYQEVMDQHWDKSKVAGNEECIQYLIQYHPDKHFEPGEKFEYSNTGYLLLASIAEEASGKDFIELCRDRIFQPLGMSQTGFRSREDKLKLENMAWGHIFVPKKQAYVPADSFPEFDYNIWLGNRKGPGRISSNAADLLKWDQALYTENLIKTSTLQEAFTPARLNDASLSRYGFGWMLGQHPLLGKKVFHTGDNPGYKTIIIRYVDSHKTLIVLCNNAHEKFDEIVGKIEAALASDGIKN